MPADEEVFKLREVEKRHKLEQREAVKRMHVHEKTTFASRMGTSLASEAVANVGYVTPCSSICRSTRSLAVTSRLMIQVEACARKDQLGQSGGHIARLGGRGQCLCDYSTQAAIASLFFFLSIPLPGVPSHVSRLDVQAEAHSHHSPQRRGPM